MNKTNKEFPFMIGADPEFNIMFEDKIVSADKLISTLYNKDHKMEKNEMGFEINKYGSIGWDGHSATGEIRPAPSKTPQGLCNNMQKLIESFVQKGKIFKLLTTSEASSVGGHVHFQITKELYGNPKLINNIHKRFISFYLPIQLGEELISTRIRTRGSYGKFADHREEKIEEDVYTYEFRTPSAEWLTTPKTAKATIAYLATIWNEILNHPKNFRRNNKLLIQTEKQECALQELALSQYMIITETLLGKIKKLVKTFEYYKDYEEEINFILNPEKVLKEKKKANFDIITGWKFPETKTPTKRILLSEKHLKETMKKTNIEDLMGLINISFNPDLNVAHFVTALKTRKLALNWKTNYEYFLFGIRKGITNYIVKDSGDNFIMGHEQIKTQLDLQEINTTFKNMKDKVYNKPNNNRIFIGIPYTERVTINIKDFIKIIYHIENDKYDLIKLKNENLIEDRNLAGKNIDKLGKIFQIYNENKISDVVDQNTIEAGRRGIEDANQMRENDAAERIETRRATEELEETLGTINKTEESITPN